MTNIQQNPHLELSLVTLLAYTAYVIAEIAGLSGVMSLFLCGICMKHYAWYSLSESGKTATHATFQTMAFLAENFVFVYIGINVFSFSPSLQWDPALIAWSMLLILIARALNIVPLSFIANIRRKVKVGWKMQVMLWFAGLRGAIAFALSMNIQDASKGVIVTTTLFIVLFTTLLLGSLTAHLLVKLDLQEPLVPPEQEMELDTSLLLNSSDFEISTPKQIVLPKKYHQIAPCLENFR